MWAKADLWSPRARRVRSSSGISSASWIASAVSERSNGLMASACRPSRPNAPAFRDRISAPPLVLTTGASIATRFMPSWTGLTSMASYRSYAATAYVKSSCSFRTIGVQSSFPYAALIRSAVARQSAP